MVMPIEANDLLDHIATLIDMPHVFTKVLNPTGSEIYIHTNHDVCIDDN